MTVEFQPLSLFDETEGEMRWFRVIGVRPAAAGEMVAELDDECVSYAGNDSPKIRVVVEPIPAGPPAEESA